MNEIKINVKKPKNKAKNKFNTKNGKKFIDREVNRQFNKINSKRGNQNHNTLSKNYGNPINKLYKNPTLADHYRAVKLAEYYIGATHPRYAVERGLDVKLPTDLPIPTACIRVTKTCQITTGVNGVLFVNYVPGSLLVTNSSATEISSLTVNTTCDGNGTAGSNYFYQFDAVDVIQVYDKWRLTASEMSLRYNGPVLNQSGSMFSCVHYEPSAIAAKGVSGTGTINSIVNSNVDRISTDFGLIKNGLWNEVIDIANQGSGITHIWSPSSSADYTFPGYVGLSATTSVVLNGTSTSNVSTTTNATVLSNAIGTTRSFCWGMTNLPTTSNCMVFEVHEVYEYIPDIGAVSVIKPTYDSPTHEEHSNLAKISNMKPTSRPYKPKRGGDFITTVQNVVSDISKHVDIPKLVGTLGKMLFV